MGTNLRRRPIDSFKAVCIHDEALDSVERAALEKYVESRDFDDIAAALEPLEEKPAIFTLDPLRPAFDGVAVNASIQDLKNVFAAHVRAIDHVPADLAPKFVRTGDKNYLDTGYVDTLPLVFVVDIAAVVIKHGQGDSDPFSPPDGYWRRRAQREVRRHAGKLA
jgi:hypothetical protein